MPWPGSTIERRAAPDEDAAALENENAQDLEKVGEILGLVDVATVQQTLDEGAHGGADALVEAVDHLAAHVHVLGDFVDQREAEDLVVHASAEDVRHVARAGAQLGRQGDHGSRRRRVLDQVFGRGRPDAVFLFPTADMLPDQILDIPRHGSLLGPGLMPCT